MIVIFFTKQAQASLKLSIKKKGWILNVSFEFIFFICYNIKIFPYKNLDLLLYRQPKEIRTQYKNK